MLNSITFSSFVSVSLAKYLPPVPKNYQPLYPSNFQQPSNYQQQEQPIYQQQQPIYQQQQPIYQQQEQPIYQIEEVFDTIPAVPVPARQYKEYLPPVPSNYQPSNYQPTNYQPIYPVQEIVEPAAATGQEIVEISPNVYEIVNYDPVPEPERIVQPEPVPEIITTRVVQPAPAPVRPAPFWQGQRVNAHTKKMIFYCWLLGECSYGNIKRIALLEAKAEADPTHKVNKWRDIIEGRVKDIEETWEFGINTLKGRNPDPNEEST